ncbi:CPCC family cysteine-rich protein [Pseudomonas donghuensis]|uniref:CPCC family cysteine-rich protein n=1 Tax=Pseudomonas donghuensis TaxID=1163398 RepID=UPI0009DA1A1A|nr:CPCC family cysteine-rich protein [Pseudomonas donghuensis]
MFTCPCCGYAVFEEHPGSYGICPICFWEDDVFQLYYPHQAGGPNRCSLIEAQVNFVQFGACERTMSKNVRVASDSDVRDGEWFPLWARRVAIPDPDSDNQHPQHMKSKYDLYYWLRT